MGGHPGGGVIVLATAAAFSSSFVGAFVRDDLFAITGNPTIRQLWPLWNTLCPPNTCGETVSGRPLLNLSFAVNYAISGYEVWSYHATNLAIHILAPCCCSASSGGRSSCPRCATGGRRRLFP